MELHHILKIYIEQVVSESGRQIMDKTWFQRLFAYPPIELERFINGNPMFARDNSFGYQSTFFLGKDFSLLLLNIAVYELFDLASGNTLIALFITYLFEQGLLWVRGYFGARNISAKTLVDDTFLI